MQINLRKKLTFNELINYLEVKQPKIKYPDRTATFLRHSHYLSQFDGNLLDVEEQQKKNKNALSNQPPAIQKETGSSVELLQSHTGEALDAFGGLGACGLLAPQPLGTAERPVPPSTTAPQAPSSRRAAARSRAC